MFRRSVRSALFWAQGSILGAFIIYYFGGLLTIFLISWAPNPILIVKDTVLWHHRPFWYFCADVQDVAKNGWEAFDIKSTPEADNLQD